MHLRATTTCGSLTPGSEYKRDLVRRGTIFPEAAKRLRWKDHYAKSRNARLTCRYFGICPKTFYRWENRFDPYVLTSLEDESRRPRHVRQPQTPAEVVEAILELRTRYSRWGKKKLVVLLARKRRRKPRYAIRKPKDYRAVVPGDLVQVDTLQVKLVPNEIRYQFSARES